jgi:hypothetical protein
MRVANDRVLQQYVSIALIVCLVFNTLSLSLHAPQLLPSLPPMQADAVGSESAVHPVTSSLPPRDFVPQPLRAAPAAIVAAPLQQAGGEARILSDGKRPIATGTTQGFPARFANDGDETTAWQSNVGIEDTTWQIGFTRLVTVTKFVSNWGVFSQSLKYRIYLSQDGVTFPTEVTSNLIGSVTGQIENAITPQKAKAVRIVIIDASGYSGTSADLYEFQVFGIASVHPQLNTPPAECPCDNSQGKHPGKPFNPRTGFLWTKQTDLSLPSNGPALVWERSYASNATGDTTSPLGRGWYHPYMMRLIAPGMSGSETDRIIIITPEGSRIRFNIIAPNTYEPFPGVYSTLTRSGSDYVQTLRDQSQYIFGSPGFPGVEILLFGFRKR